MGLIKKISSKPVKVFWWRYNYPKELNFGDEITPILIRKIFDRKAVWREPSGCDLAGVGSIIQGVSDRSNGNPVSIWGSGFIEELPKRPFPNLTFYAVRGALSLSQIEGPRKDIALGDPALLLPLAIKVRPKKKKYRVGIIPHYVDVNSPKLDRFRNNSDVLFIDVLQTVKNVIFQINECELILSSSLHGLIVSDAYNIPNIWTPLSNQVYGGAYKFDDYYSVFNRTSQPRDITNIEIQSVNEYIETYQSISSTLEKVQTDLIHAFYKIDV